MKKIISFMIIALMLVGLGGCGRAGENTNPSSDATDKENTASNQPAADEANNKGSEAKKVIVMGTNAEFPPFEYREGDKITGFDVEVAQKVADKLGVELKVEDMLFDALIPSLQAGKIDFIAAGMSVTDERKKNVEFSNGYYEASQVIITKKDNTEIKGVNDLKNKVIGVQLGTTGDAEAQKIEGAEVVQFNAGFAAIMDLMNDKVDAVVLDSEPAKNFASVNDQIQILSEQLTQEEYAIAAKKGDTELVEAINTVLEEMKSNGEYDALINKYFKSDEEAK